jgi:hypothetical protein
MNKSAVLGAIGSIPGARPARSIRPESHPPREVTPAATAMMAQMAASGLNLQSRDESFFIASPDILADCNIVGQ